MMKLVPGCCGQPLTSDMSVRGKEYKCEKCGRYYEIFDHYSMVPEPQEPTTNPIEVKG